MKNISKKFLTTLLVAGCFTVLNITSQAEASNDVNNLRDAVYRVENKVEDHNNKEPIQDTKEDKNKKENQNNKPVDRNGEPQNSNDNKYKQQNKEQSQAHSKIKSTSDVKPIQNNKQKINHEYLDKQEQYLKETRADIKERNIKLPSNHWVYGKEIPKDIRVKYEKERGSEQDNVKLLLDIMLKSVLSDARK